jgi:acetate kinase
MEKPSSVIPVAISARHVHLSQPTVERLFGAGHQLRPKVPLSQPGQYACVETVTLRGPRGCLEHVRVLGPPRSADQVEISRTDEIALGIDAPVRLSGDLESTPGVVIEGPAGSVTLNSGVVCALRHIHMSPEDAEHFGVSDGQIVQVEAGSPSRAVIFTDVVVRVAPHYRLEFHLDTDEGNAAGIEAGAMGKLIHCSA